MGTDRAGATTPDADARIADLPARLAVVRARVAAAATAADRSPQDVRILLASKTMPVEVVRAAVVAGADLLGENRVQELVAKAPALADLGPAVHVIGPLQSNKVNAALAWAACVQSVDTLDLARRLSSRCVATDRDLEVMVQVNVSGEPTKHGVAPADAVALATAVAALPRLRLTGLMTVGARSHDVALVRSGYRLLRELRDAVAGSGAPGTAGATELSMGMSGDIEAAVAEGSTLLRIGSAAFGPRAPLA
ncbi:YggS family pyridoxal phosphate-dependent enzyme [Actinotalea sp.]|uniref:YggS family pyridoxal phosphate-dependent enzyme n=1 Tax=Actinotalea sp. TaxID=1872145 RepID=UPI002B943B47|nr:YggS family pyridoxal phosphate-dependent enzyme [Actinotalea sp.]HQY32835.1 YggS family pyridoxal phosphate-dependent enzyme [Actinotalea sp.]HRA51753.1 YggS family pyridoxal phosphate-dependent enzyme [Actinotalea sp.]